MRILGLWVCDYYSGSTTERFFKPLKALKYEVDIIPLELKGVDYSVLKAIESNTYDYLIHVPYPNTIRPEILKHISEKTNVTTIAWNGDDEWMWNSKDSKFHPKALASIHNYCVTTDKNSLQKYKDALIETVVLGQWGFSASDWKKKKVKKEYDLYFCGAKTPERDHFLRVIKDEGLDIKIEGPGYSQKKIELNEMIQGYRKARIGLNFVSGARGDYFYQQVKARNFEIPAVGTFQLSEHCPALERFFKPGDSIDTFKSVDEMLKKISHYLKKEKEREAIALKGFTVNKQYSYENIFKNIFNKIEGKVYCGKA